MLLRNGKKTTSEIELPNVHTKGFYMFEKVFKIDNDVENFFNQESKKITGAIFNHNGSKKNDKKRKQKSLNIKHKKIQKFMSNITNFIQTNISNTLSMNNWVMIKSLPGCQDQAAHSDYCPSEKFQTLKNNQYPLLVIVALMDDTKLNVWPNSIGMINETDKELSKRKPIKCQTMSMNKGDVFVFRADLIHAGSGYDKENHRLHCYLDSEYIKREPNKTWCIGDSYANPKVAKLIVPKKV